MSIMNFGTKVGLSGLVVAMATLSVQITTPAQTTAPTAGSLSQAVVASGPKQSSPKRSNITLRKNVAASGSFVGQAHPTSGAAKIITENGQRYLELDAAFRTDAGPDLLVLLHNQAVPNSYAPENYVSLGQVQRIGGAQRYAIPADADLQNIQSVAIWCRAFDVTFGYATL